MLRRALGPITVTAKAGVLAIALFSATAFGLAILSSYLPGTGTSSLGMAVAAADPCGDRCGGGGQGSYGPDTSGFEPPGMPDQLPDYQSGANSGYPAPDQAVGQVTQQAGQQGATQAASQGLPKPPPPYSCSGQITNTAAPTRLNANNALTMAQLVQRVYDPAQPPPAGWSQLSSAQVEQLSAINPDTYTVAAASGVHVGVFTDGAGHYVWGSPGPKISSIKLGWL